MAFNFEGFLLNPFALIAVTVVLGGYFGRLNFRGLKLGSSGSLFVGLGYAIGYIPGVLMVVFGMRLVPKWLGIDLDSERASLAKTQKAKGEDGASNTQFDVVLFMFICACGILLGQVKVYFGSYLGWINLGSTGGVLVASLLIGHLYASKTGRLPLSKPALIAIRDLSLNMFLAIVGLRYGYTTVTSIASDGFTLLIAAVISGSIAMLTGVIVGRGFMKMNWIILAGAICGAMTSTPGLAAALETCEADEVAASYGATYPVALISMILFTTIMTYLV